jgi:hypothetical protein
MRGRATTLPSRPVRRPPRAVAVRALLLAVTVGAAVTAAAAFFGAGGCGNGDLDAGVRTPVDSVCYDLVRTLAEHTGLVAAAATAVLFLTFVGLSRLAEQPPSASVTRPEGSPPHRS